MNTKTRVIISATITAIGSILACYGLFNFNTTLEIFVVTGFVIMLSGLLWFCAECMAQQDREIEKKKSEANERR